MARIVASAVVGVEPRIMGIGPVKASNKALEKAGLTMEDMDVIELNEAFASQALACIRAWGLQDDDPRINPNGGSIAIGHPLGVTGARITYSAALELQQTKKKYRSCYYVYRSRAGLCCYYRECKCIIKAATEALIG